MQFSINKRAKIARMSLFIEVVEVLYHLVQELFLSRLCLKT